jgi:quinol monooxygenase YgiN
MVTHMHIGFRVEDYDRWKRGYDASAEHRKSAGEISFRIFRDVDDPKLITVVSVQESAERVRAFLDSPELKEGMKKAGILEMGKMLILEEAGSGIL